MANPGTILKLTSQHIDSSQTPFGKQIRKGGIVPNISQFLQDYDAAAEDVIHGNHRTYARNLQRWLHVVDRESPLGPVVADLGNTLDAERWLNEEMAAPQVSMGGGQFTWPLDRRELMGRQLFLCRFFSGDTSNTAKLGLRFFRRSTENMDGVVSNINREVFVP